MTLHSHFLLLGGAAPGLLHLEAATFGHGLSLRPIAQPG